MSILKNYTTLFLFFNLYCSQCFGFVEEFPTYSIVQLSVVSDEIVEAKFLNKKENDYYFLTRPIESKNDYKDTLVVKRINQLFNTSENRYNKIRFENSEKLIIYLSSESGTRSPSFSGYRLLKDGQIYTPAQPENPGKFSFAGNMEKLSWADLKARIIQVHKRISHIKGLRKIQDPFLKNQKLFEWIETQQHTFEQDCPHFDSDCRWGAISLDVFNWITESNIAKDTWKASLLFRTVNSKSNVKWMRSYDILREENNTSFTSYKDIDFLVTKATNETTIMAERRQALTFLKPAVRKVYENNYPIPDSSKLAFQTEKQLSIRTALFPLLKDSILKEQAFHIIRRLSNPMDGNLKHRINLDLLPSLIEVYPTEKPSRFRSDLAEFIVYNATKYEWKKLTDCDEKILVDLYQVRIDTIKKELIFGLYYKSGKGDINNLPEIVIQSVTDKDAIYKRTASSLKLPYRHWQGVRYLRTPIDDLPKDNYRVYLVGKTGENNEFNWKSEYGEFTIE